MVTPENAHPGLEIYERVYRGSEISSQGCSCWAKKLLRESQSQVQDQGCSVCAQSLAGTSEKRRDKRAEGSLCLLLPIFH